MKDSQIFLDFAESLKLVRKTRIEDFIDDKNIDDIYTDLLPNNGIINKLNLPRTTLLIGRKGTGKSTIFQKSQKDLVSNKKCISIYIDVKSLYDNSTPDIPEEAKKLSIDFHKYLLYSNLVKEIILETRNRLDDFVKGSILKKILGFDHEQILAINQELDEIDLSIKDVIRNVDMSLIQSFKRINENNSNQSQNAGIKLSEIPTIELSASSTSMQSAKSEFEQTLVKYLDIKKSLINNLIKIKEILKIDHLYIFLDDYSEIDEQAQKVFMDWFIAPLDNLSNDFVKFKIAAYPNRFYYGRLDNAKIDEISLDFFDAFYSFEKKVNISKMETLALDYTKRLMKKRLDLFFPNNHWERFFEMNEDELIDLLFSVSFNIPRKIGYILSYCYESCLIHNHKITKVAIENASQRYYSDIILKYFLANQFVSKPFADKISNEHQFELLNKIIERQKINSSPINRSIIKGKPTNHFTVNKKIASLLNNLELNGFITTYNHVVDNSSELSVIYSLDYGLCKWSGLNFRRADNLKVAEYFAHSRFNMNVLITEYFNKTQVIKCNVGHEFPYEMLENLKLFKMNCPTCVEDGKFSPCELTLSNAEIKDQLESIENSLHNKVSFYEFQVLDYLKTINKTVSTDIISNALDKSSTTVIATMHKLNEKGFVIQDLEVSRELKKDYYSITIKGSKIVTKILSLIEEIIEKKKNPA
jgi:DNA-binding PadR family transcriptional regulator